MTTEQAELIADMIVAMSSNDEHGYAKFLDLKSELIKTCEQIIVIDDSNDLNLSGGFRIKKEIMKEILKDYQPIDIYRDPDSEKIKHFRD